MAALAWARIGDTARAQSMASELGQRFPKNTLIRYYWLPTIKAGLALRQSDPAQALEFLQTVAPYELADGSFRGSGWSAGYPIYLRGEVYLMAGDAAKAAAEFQKVVDHPGVVENSLTGPLAYLGLARASARSGDNARARQAYENLFRVWQSADPDIPIYKQAKAEYAKLQ